MHFNWLRSLLADNRSTKRTSRKRRPWVSEVETLEARAVPAIYHVTGMTDGAGVISASGLDFNASTLRAAINDANLQPGDDTIVLPSGTYTINTSGEGELLINSNITIDGAGASDTIIDNGYRAGRVFHVTGDATTIVTIEGVTITGGSVTDEGAGILLDSTATLNLNQSIVTYNSVQTETGDVYGGGISVNLATLNVTDSTISYNSAYGGDGAPLGSGQANGYLAAGGGIATRAGQVTLLRSTVDHNNVYGGSGVSQIGNYYGGAAQGGGIASLTNSNLIITNSTIANNSANGGQGVNGGEGFGGEAYGGGVYSDAIAALNNSTIAYNTALGGAEFGGGNAIGSGGGFASGGGLASTQGSIIAKNTASALNPDVSGLIASFGSNLIGDAGTTSSWLIVIDKVGGSFYGPVLDPLFASNQVADNGGLTFTLGLLPASPAVNGSVVPSSVTSDQRGGTYLRTFGLSTDIGAFELQGPGVETTPGSTAASSNSPAVAVDAGVTVFDTQDVTGATVIITGGFIPGQDVLAYPTVIGNITGTYLNGVLTLTGVDTAANYTLALRSITYQNTSLIPITLDRTITFAATDVLGTSAPATRLVTVAIGNNDPTVANVIPPQTATEDTAFNFTFALNTFADIDLGDTLTYTATGLPAWLSFDGATRTFTGTPGNGDVTTSPLTITVTATDSFLATVSTTFALSVTNVNDTPTVATPIGPQTATEDTAFSFTFGVNTFADVDVGDTLTYTATGLPAWLSFDGATRTFTGTPTNGDVTTSPVTITVTATDGSLATVSTTFALSVTNVNDAPTVANVISPQTATEDTAFSFTFGVNTFADVDVGDTLAYTATGLPAWLSFDGATRTFTGTPANGDVTTIPLTITVTATDGSLATVSTTFALTVTNVNDAPTVATPIGPQTATEDTAFSFTFGVNTFADVDVGDTLTYTATGLPSWLSFDAATRTFTGTPDDADTGVSPLTITVTATDAALATVSTTFQLTIIPVNDHTPVFTAPSQTVSLLEFTPNGTTVATVHATDDDLPAEALQYSITGGNASGAFTIDPTTGVITVADASKLDHDVIPTFVLTISVTDQGTPSPLTATATVTVNLTQTGPTITLSEVQGTYHIGKNTALVSPLATFTNNADDNPDFSAAQLTVSITAGRSSKDVLSVLAKGDPSGHIRVKGRNVFYDNVKIGTVKGGKGRQPDLVVTFNAQASTAAVDALLRRVNITAKDQIGQIRTVQFQITNISGVDSNTATRDIQVVPMGGAG